MIVLLLAAMLGAEPTPGESWSGFRGDGTSVADAERVPVKWSPTENLAWRVELPGYGQSSPVVWGEKIFVTAIEGEQKEKLLIVALDAKTGAVIWKKEFRATQKGKNNPMMSRAAPTPVVDAAGVYAFFESGDLVALTHHGEVRWERSFVKDYGELKNNHGIGSSPVQTEKSVIVLVDHAGPSYLVAIDKSSGKDIWKIDRPSRSSWTSPVIATFREKPILLVSSGGAVDAYDPATGKRLVSTGGFVGNTIPSPTVAGDLVLVGAGENRMKPDLAASARSNCCLRLTSKEGELVFETAWQGKKVISQHASPLAYRDHAYFVTRAGLVHCLDLKSGEERYAERLDNPTWATPIGAGGYLYFFGKDGVTTVLKSGSNYEKVASNRLWSEADFARRRDDAKKHAQSVLPKSAEGKGPGGRPALSGEDLEATRYSAVGDVVYGVAVVNGSFIIRTGTELFCIRESKPEPKR